MLNRMKTWATAAADRPMETNLVIFMTFALIALVFLTRTVISARQIDTNVDAAIRPTTSSIDKNTALIPALERIHDKTAEIARRSQSIGGSVKGIASDASELNTQITDERGLVLSIGGHVNSINASVAGIASGVKRIANGTMIIRQGSSTTEQAFSAVEGSVADIERGIAESNSSVRAIGRGLPPIIPVLGRIDAVLQETDKHVIAIENNIAIRLSNLFKLLGL